MQYTVFIFDSVPASGWFINERFDYEFVLNINSLTNRKERIFSSPIFSILFWINFLYAFTLNSRRHHWGLFSGRCWPYAFRWWVHSSHETLLPEIFGVAARNYYTSGGYSAFALYGYNTAHVNYSGTLGEHHIGTQYSFFFHHNAFYHNTATVEKQPSSIITGLACNVAPIHRRYQRLA